MNWRSSGAPGDTHPQEDPHLESGSVLQSASYTYSPDQLEHLSCGKPQEAHAEELNTCRAAPTYHHIHRQTQPVVAGVLLRWVPQVRILPGTPGSVSRKYPGPAANLVKGFLMCPAPYGRRRLYTADPFQRLPRCSVIVSPPKGVGMPCEGSTSNPTRGSPIPRGRKRARRRTAGDRARYSIPEA